MWFAPLHATELQASWAALGERSGLGGTAWTREGKRLVRSWARWPRRYHNTPHLLACLNHFEQVRDQLDDPLAAEWALWFHDAIYIPWRPLNEEKSAAWAVRFMRQMNLPQALCDQVSTHILDTRHQAVPTSGDAQWIVDIDLAILGQHASIYRQFEKDVRSEYRWVRWSGYVKGRSAVLQSFLNRPRIYSTPWFHDKLEASARANLTAAVQALAAGHLFDGLERSK